MNRGPSEEVMRRSKTCLLTVATDDFVPGAFVIGLLVIDEGLVREGCYAGLLEMVSEETWRHTRVRPADQLVLNRYFAGRQTLVSSTCNYLPTMDLTQLPQQRGVARIGRARLAHRRLGPVLHAARARQRLHHPRRCGGDVQHRLRRHATARSSAWNARV